MSEKASASKKPGRARGLLRDAGVLLGLAGLALGTWQWISPRSSPINYLLTADAVPAVPRPQRPTTLPPALFTGRVAEGYRVARERPALLEQMPCYCGCYVTDGHQNNLDCFRDRHGETCEMCLVIALRAEKLEKAGYGYADIKAIVDRDYAPRGK